MARRQQTKGVCTICEGTFGKQAMSRHLAKCLAGQEQGAGVAQGKHRKTKLFHLVVQGKYASEYWLHLEVPATATLQDLDTYLRSIWLECCGHLSAFTIGDWRYNSSPENEWGESGMSTPLSRVLGVGTAFHYEYDFGSTTELNLKVLGLRTHAGKGVKLLARNEAPRTVCDACGTALATQICTECASCGDGGWLCADCGTAHECGEEMFLPVANSPRAGVCAYSG